LCCFTIWHNFSASLERLKIDLIGSSWQLMKCSIFSTFNVTIGLWHEIQNRLKNTWFDVVFHADSDSIFFKF
jgi:hypothetical protein